MCNDGDLLVVFQGCLQECPQLERNVIIVWNSACRIEIEFRGCVFEGCHEQICQIFVCAYSGYERLPGFSRGEDPMDENQRLLHNPPVHRCQKLLLFTKSMT